MIVITLAFYFSFEALSKILIRPFEIYYKSLCLGIPSVFFGIGAFIFSSYCDDIYIFDKSLIVAILVTFIFYFCFRALLKILEERSIKKDEDRGLHLC